MSCTTHYRFGLGRIRRIRRDTRYTHYSQRLITTTTAHAHDVIIHIHAYNQWYLNSQFMTSSGARKISLHSFTRNLALLAAALCGRVDVWDSSAVEEREVRASLSVD